MPKDSCTLSRAVSGIEAEVVAGQIDSQPVKPSIRLRYHAACVCFYDPSASAAAPSVPRREPRKLIPIVFSPFLPFAAA